MLGRLFTGAVRQGVSSTPRRAFGAGPHAAHPIEEQFYVTPRINGELPLPGSYTINPKVLLTHFASITSIIGLYVLNKETRAVPVQMEKVSIADPTTGEVRSYMKPTGVFDQTSAVSRAYPGYEIVRGAAPNRVVNREGDVLAAMEQYNAQMDSYAHGDLSFIGRPGQLFFPDKADIMPSLECPKSA